MRLLTLLLFFFISSFLYSQVLIDEFYEDWTEENLRTIDNSGDVSSEKIDFTNLWVSNDQEYLFISFDLGKEINLQDNNNLSLYIDFDNKISTGLIVNGIGADLIYNFGDREGFMFIDGFQYFLSHNDIGLITQPTVSSERFEIAIQRNGSIAGDNYSMADIIRLHLEDEISNGDKVPDETGGLIFNFDNSIQQNSPSYSFSKSENNHLRILCYNSLFDGLFENDQRDAQRRIIKSMDPDIIGFQEIYDRDANEVATVIESLLPLDGGAQWYRSKISPDIIVISKFPIVGIYPIDGNGAFRIDLGDKELLLIVAHLPCCGNNEGRQNEVDNIIAFLRQAKDGSAGFTLTNGSPIVIMGDLNLVGDRRQRETLLEGDILDESTYGPDINPDWDGGPLIDARFYNTGQPTSATWFDASSSFNPGRLDYIIYSGSVMSLENSFSVYTPSMANADLDNLGLNRFDSDVSSDHIALVGDFEVGLTSSSNLVSQKPIDFLVFPNPTFSELTIEFEVKNSSSNKISYRVINHLGQKVLQKDQAANPGINKIKINIEHLNAGTYYLDLNTDNGSLRKPFIKL